MKVVPTIDYQLYRVSGYTSRFELMLRGNDGILQSVHRFCARDRTSIPYVLPVVVKERLERRSLNPQSRSMRPLDGESDLLSGQVVELGVDVTSTIEQHAVHFDRGSTAFQDPRDSTTMQVREGGKQPEHGS